MRDPLRKAAILIKSLDKATADGLLAQMPPDAAERVLAAARTLAEIEPSEQQEVMRDFLARQTGISNQVTARSLQDVELSLSAPAMERQHRPTSNTPNIPKAQVSSSPKARFDFVTAESIETLARVLSCEQPQLTALILAHLPPQHSAATLAMLDPVARDAIVERIADLCDASPEILDEIEAELMSRLQREELRIAGSANGIAALSGILHASDPALRQQISSAMGSRKPLLLAPRQDDRTIEMNALVRQATQSPPNLATKTTAEIVRPAPVIPFTSLNDLDDISLAAVFGAVSPQIAILALVGADQALVGRILRLLPRKESAHFRKKLEEVGPLRLKEIEFAQNQLSNAAYGLMEDRRISVIAPQTRPVAA